ncbi:MAG: S-methyl-5'-thioadenosine phosphorylase [Candidatus Methylacidiphilales bacterium]
MNHPDVSIAVIGGSGVYDFPGLTEAGDHRIETPFGAPSDLIRVGKLHGKSVAFLPRHGRHHTLAPPVLPHRANIYALKSLGVKWIISLSAVGSLKESLIPGHFVIPLQFFDRTKNSRHHSFFEEGIVAHVSFGDPVCSRLAALLYQAASSAGVQCHWGGTYVNMEGPVFSTRAESDFHRAMGFDVVGMTNLAEAKLAREAEISYATVAMVTDYDCWHQSLAEVNVSDVINILHDNAALAAETVQRVVVSLSTTEETAAHRALHHAFATPRAHWDPLQIERLSPLIHKYL